MHKRLKQTHWQRMSKVERKRSIVNCYRSFVKSLVLDRFVAANLSISARILHFFSRISSPFPSRFHSFLSLELLTNYSWNMQRSNSECAWWVCFFSFPCWERNIRIQIRIKIYFIYKFTVSQSNAFGNKSKRWIDEREWERCENNTTCQWMAIESNKMFCIFVFKWNINTIQTLCKMEVCFDVAVLEITSIIWFRWTFLFFLINMQKNEMNEENAFDCQEHENQQNVYRCLRTCAYVNLTNFFGLLLLLISSSFFFFK